MFGMFVSAEPHGRVTLVPGNLISAVSIFCKLNLDQADSRRDAVQFALNHSPE